MTFSSIPRLSLAHTPTPLWRSDRLDELIGTRVWVKRDDMTAGAAAGNKIRKLEYLLAAAQAEGATVVLTCGAAQSNHARATALLCAQLGLRCELLLRTERPLRSESPGELSAALDEHRDCEPVVGNLLLDHLAGARVHWASPQSYRERSDWLRKRETELAARGERAFVIPEGGSSALGALGYVRAMQEVREQLDRGEAPGAPPCFDAVVHACGSGGTAAGCAVGAAAFGVAAAVIAVAVRADSEYFQGVIRTLCAGIAELAPDLPAPVPVSVPDRFIGPGYGSPGQEHRDLLAAAASGVGLVLDPAYSVKALLGLRQMPQQPDPALFLHTGGLPGLLAFGEALRLG